MCEAFVIRQAPKHVRSEAQALVEIEVYQCAVKGNITQARVEFQVESHCQVLHSGVNTAQPQCQGQHAQRTVCAPASATNSCTDKLWP